MIKKSILVNTLISSIMFMYIFYKCAGQSGGDIAIIVFNVMFGVFQLLVNSVYLWIKKSNMITKIQLTIIIIQTIELIICIIYGYQINEWIKNNYK